MAVVKLAFRSVIFLKFQRCDGSQVPWFLGGRVFEMVSCPHIYAVSHWTQVRSDHLNLLLLSKFIARFLARVCFSDPAYYEGQFFLLGSR